MAILATWTKNCGVLVASLLMASAAQASPIVEIEAFASGFNATALSTVPNAAPATLTLTNYAATAGNSGYSAGITISGFDIAAGGPSLSLATQLLVASASSPTTGYGSSPPPALTLELTETGVPATGRSGFDSSLTAIFTRHANNVAFSTYFDPNNAAFGTTDLVYATSVTGTSGQLSSFNPTNAASIAANSVYSITEIFTFTPVATASTPLHPTIDGNANVLVPEPAALPMLAAALIGLLLLRRRAC